MSWVFPLMGPTRWPDAPGRFGARRRYDVHTGIDLYVEEGTVAIAAEDGVVVAIEDFTGPSAGTPWWNDTKGVYVEGPSGVLVYGEVDNLWVRLGNVVKAGSPIGVVKRVLLEDKGRPCSMLHFEQHVPGTRTGLAWQTTQPRSLRDPTNQLKESWASSEYYAGEACVTNLEVKVRETNGLETWVEAPMHVGWSPSGDMAEQISGYAKSCAHRLDTYGYLIDGRLLRVHATEILGVRQRVR